MAARPRNAVRARPAVRYVPHGAGRGLNAARNTGLREAGGELIAFVDDDVLAPPGWLQALVRGRAAAILTPRRSAGRSARASRATSAQLRP